MAFTVTPSPRGVPGISPRAVCSRGPPVTTAVVEGGGAIRQAKKEVPLLTLEGSTPRGPCRNPCVRPVLGASQVENIKVEQAKSKIQDAACTLNEIQKEFAELGATSVARTAKPNDRRGQVVTPRRTNKGTPTASQASANCPVAQNTPSRTPLGPAARVMRAASTATPSQPGCIVLHGPSTCRATSPVPRSDTQVRTAPLCAAPSTQPVQQQRPRPTSPPPATGLAAMAMAAVATGEDARAGLKKKLDTARAALDQVEDMLNDMPTSRRGSYHSGMVLAGRAGPPRQARTLAGVAAAPSAAAGGGTAPPLVPMAVRHVSTSVAWHSPNEALGASSSFTPAPPLLDMALGASSSFTPAPPLLDMAVVMPNSARRAPPPITEVVGLVAPTSGHPAQRQTSRSQSPSRGPAFRAAAVLAGGLSGTQASNAGYPHQLIASWSAVASVADAHGVSSPGEPPCPPPSTNNCDSGASSPMAGGSVGNGKAPEALVGNPLRNPSEDKVSWPLSPGTEEADLQELSPTALNEPAAAAPPVPRVAPTRKDESCWPPILVFETEPLPSTADTGYAKDRVDVPSPHAYENHPGPQIADFRYGGPRTPLGQCLRSNLQHHEVRCKVSKAADESHKLICN